VTSSVAALEAAVKSMYINRVWKPEKREDIEMK